MKKNNLLPKLILAILFQKNEIQERLYFKTFSMKKQYLFQ
ncbi:conserved domain protein [Streptococcus parauberis NCFD 2020]|uniref:Conserved domain protein n=2 Tax=Streptococcus parauberis TaxID=1348 RepID=F1Z2Y8_9STRE|nr:conserved domain protein [Streptococcus parauberis NCFD 2020]EMG25348.1 hypothetical protein SPJ1_0759 [Streptococcus parauberis KRS-02083]